MLLLTSTRYIWKGIIHFFYPSYNRFTVLKLSPPSEISATTSHTHKNNTMKTAIIFLLLLAVVLIGIGWYQDSLDTVKDKDFKIEMAKVRRELDSVKANQDTIKREIRDMQIDLDTIKTGNEVIFRTMQENQSRSFFDFF